uniref:Helix-turn-helix domain-containing protein n=1 Tax=Streptomyces sp. NBC_00003 TaxID=2903608 RepID=A0AAU2VBR9_9ACTN
MRLVYDGEHFTIAEIQGRRVLLQQTGADGRAAWRQVDIAVLLNDASTDFLTPAPPAQAATAVVLGGLDEDADAELEGRLQHVQEVRTGYQLGSEALALPGEPRAAYGPGTPWMRRYQAKAKELGVDPATVRRWVAQVNRDGPAGLVRKRGGGSLLERADTRWVDMARSVLASQVPSSRPVKNLTLIEIEERCAAQYGRGVVRLPGRTTGYALLGELSAGTNAFTGSTKGKRSIANRPKGAYGRLRATRPGEYVILDTNSLDVFAMEPVTCRWVRCELTVAMDLYSRCITGLRLTPVSTKSVDVAGVLYETVRPRPGPAGHGPDGDRPGALPYAGVPSVVLLDPDRLVDRDGKHLLPTVAAETIVYDHGKIYLSHHIASVCTKFGISLQPARPYMPTDKPIERWFKTLNEGLLAALPGYKGSDVHSRGLDVEEETFFFLDELEAIIREWITTVYHRRIHKGLTVAEIPGLDLCPLDMFEHGLHRAGPLRIPARPGLAYEFLEEQWTTIQHYGVQVNTLRYNGDALGGYRNQRSPYRGAHDGLWPVMIDRDDIRHVYFQDPKTRHWHTLTWEHAPALDGPASLEALTYARRLAVKTHRFPDTKRALVELLERWGAGLTRDRAERRMAARLSAERHQLAGPEGETEQAATEVAQLPTVNRLAALTMPASADGQDVPGMDSGQVASPSLHVVPGSGEVPVGGDDDEDDECDALAPDDHLISDTDGEDDNDAGDDFYADVLDSR